MTINDLAPAGSLMRDLPFVQDESPGFSLVSLSPPGVQVRGTMGRLFVAWGGPVAPRGLSRKGRIVSNQAVTASPMTLCASALGCESNG